MKTQETAATLLQTLLEEGATASRADGSLLERFATGDRASAEAAFHALVDRHAAMVFRTCRGILGDEHEARDASQATFLILFRRGRSIWVGSSLGPWLHRVACRTARRARAGAARRRDLERRIADRRVVADRSPELVAAIHDELDRLPARFRVPIILCDLEGHTREEAARRIDCPIGTLASRLARGRERLKIRLIRRGLTPSSGLGVALLTHGPVVVPMVVARPLVSISPTVVQLARGLVQKVTMIKLLGSSLVLVGGLGLATVVKMTPTPGPTPTGPSSSANQTPGKTPLSPVLPSDRPIPQPAPVAQNPLPREPISIVGRVVEQGSGKPVAGAELFVTEFRRGDQLPQWEAPTRRSAPDGRFAMSVPITKVGDPNEVGVLVGIRHPDTIAVRSFLSQTTLERISRQAKPDPFGEITLQRPLLYTARVVAPDGQPVAGIPYRFTRMNSADNQSAFFDWWETPAGQTDAEGRIQQRMPATTSLFLRLDPERFAPWQHFWGKNDPLVGPLSAIPSDLGLITLDPGVTLAGRLINQEGKPVAAQRITATERSHDFMRTATTADDGRFAFTPLRPGNYLVQGDGQDQMSRIGRPDAPISPSHALIIRPSPVFLTQGVNPSPLEIREAETVAVSVRFVNSQGRPAPGVPVTLVGFLPGEGGDTRPYYRLWPEYHDQARWYNDLEPNLTGGRLDWSIWLRPDDAGVVSFRAPRHLREAEVKLDPGDHQTVFKIRLSPGGPLEWRPHNLLGQLDAERTEIEVVSYHAPEVVVRVATKGGEPIPPDTTVYQEENIRGGDYGTTAIRQPDGSFLIRGMVPDQETEITAGADGYVLERLQRLNFAEGAKATVDLILRPTPTPPAVGAAAPPFRITTLDGQVRSLGDYRGKFLLIHVWSPFFQWDQDLPRLDAIRHRWGEDRLALLGLSITADTEAARQTIATRRLTWPQAILRDRGADPLMVDFDAMYPPKSFLIGPDGKVVARDLVGEAVDEAVGGSLGSEVKVR